MDAELGWSVPEIILTESRSLFTVVIRATTIITSKRFLVDIAAIRDCYENRDITRIRRVRSGNHFG